MELLLSLRVPKKDFLAGEVKLFMCFAMFPPALPVRFTVGFCYFWVGLVRVSREQRDGCVIGLVYWMYHRLATHPRP